MIKLKLTFWRLLCLLIPVFGLILWFGLLSPWLPSSLAADSEVLHVLNRLSFGPGSGDISQIKSTGIEAYIQSQLSPESIPEPPKLTRQLNQLKTLQMSPVELFREYGPPRGRRRQQLSPEERRMARRGRRKIVEEAVQAHLLRAIASPQQLQEVMVDFWFNHFNVSAGKGQVRFWVGAYEQQALRPHALGRFRDLLAATARHPAMLFYLDNWQNTAPNSSGARGRFKGLNENYARELMELHTLGVDGGYTQEDVIALARIFTGWTIDRQGKRGDGNGFYFNPNRHDYSDKVFLGTTIKGGGIAEGEQALDILAHHRSTARHISYKLAQYFVADRPPASLVDRLTKRFLETDGEIRAVLETLFQSPEFLNPKYYSSKFKTPYQYLISTVRATGGKNPNFRVISSMLRQLGMPLYGCQTPNGYKNTQEAWLNPDAMLRRVSFATAIASGRLDKRKPINAAQLTKTLGNQFSRQTQEVVKTSPPRLRAALILGSREMMHR